MDTVHDPEKHNSEQTSPRMDAIPNGHDPVWAQSRINTIPNRHDLKWKRSTLSRMGTYIYIIIFF